MAPRLVTEYEPLDGEAAAEEVAGEGGQAVVTQERQDKPDAEENLHKAANITAYDSSPKSL